MITRQNKESKIIKFFFDGILYVSFIFLLIMLCLRGYISGHWPLSNGFETMQFLSCIALFITILFKRLFKPLIAYGFIVAGFTLMVSAMGSSNPKITPLTPVLNSPLLSIHVALIMISYALFFFIMINGIAGLILIKRDKDQADRLKVVSNIILYPAIFLLTAGIFVGAVWANVSWGRYWGWDPKEVWALITMLIYSFAIHSTSIKKFNSSIFFHVYGIVAFLSVIITYFGVNYILGGLHSYAN